MDRGRSVMMVVTTMTKLFLGYNNIEWFEISRRVGLMVVTILN